VTALRVWAPRAGHVDAIVGDASHPMRPIQGDWWEVDVAEVDPEADYSFSVDGGPARPDPRGGRLPHGVHGPSRLVDHSSYRWRHAGGRPVPLADAVVYELHVGTFSPQGSFTGVASKLDHVVDLGATHVELMPVHSFPGRHGWGYDSVGLFAPHEPYGGPEGLKSLVDACHARELGVILDVVYNHFGPEGSYLDEFGPYRTARFETPWGDAVNFGDRGANEVRRFLLDNALSWFRDYHVDALRIDAVHAFVDLTAVHFLEELAAEVRDLGRSLGRQLFVIAESDLNDPRLLWSPERGGYGLDAQWSDDFHHALHVALTGERDGYYEDFAGLPDIARAFERTWVYQGQFSRHRGRNHGRPPDGLAPNRFLGYLQNHDQVGNRAAGERISALVDLARLKIGAALVLTAPFIPLVFAGEEWGASSPFLYFADHSDPGLREAVCDGRRREFAAFGWDPAAIPDPEDESTFRRSVLDWSELDRPPHAELLDWYRRLIALRRETAVLRDGTRPEVTLDAGHGLLAVHRPGVSVLANLGAETATLELPVFPGPLTILRSDAAILVGPSSVELPSIAVAIVAGRADGTASPTVSRPTAGTDP
jgi:maltooligosyltrehalose trehalohydrolase